MGIVLGIALGVIVMYIAGDSIRKGFDAAYDDWKKKQDKKD